MTSPYLHANAEHQQSTVELSPEAQDVQLAAGLVHLRHRRGGGGDRRLLRRPADGDVGDQGPGQRRAAGRRRLRHDQPGRRRRHAGTRSAALNRVIVDMADGYLLVTAISSGSVLGVIADRSANLGTVAYEMTLFANRAGARADARG